MITNHHSRKKRQLKYLVKNLNNLLKTSDNDLKKEINKVVVKIKYLVSELSSIMSGVRMKRILGAAALLIGISFTNTVSAQWYAYPVSDPFSITAGYTDFIQSANLIDIDNDGDLDLFTDSLTYSGYYSIATNFNYQENIGTPTNPIFKNPELNPFNLAIPSNDSSLAELRHFIDLDNDGDFDVLSNIWYQGYNGLSSEFRYYENVGTPTIASFTSSVSNPFNLQGAQASIESLAAGDIDNDGDYDLIIAQSSYYGGAWRFIENVGTSTNPLFSPPQPNIFSLPNTIGVTLPTLTDFDGDGDLDIFFAEESYQYGGIFKYIENIGTTSAAQFTAPIINPSSLDASMYDSAPTPEFKDLDGDGDLDLLTATYEGTLYYENVGVPQPVTFECINYSCVDPGTGNGTYTTMSACQTNCTAPVTFECDWYSSSCYDPGDGSGFFLNYADCMLDCAPGPTWDCDGLGNCYDPGNGFGQYFTQGDCMLDCAQQPTWDCNATLGCIDPGTGAGLYASLAGCQASCSYTATENTEENNLKLYPNPVNNTLNVSSDKKINKIEIYDALGRVIYTESNPSFTINVEQLEAGLYSIAIIFDDNIIVKKFTK